MALSMDEERILAEIEQRLARSEPALAARLASFGRPGPAALLRSPRIRVLASCAVLVVVTVVSLAVYALLPLRAVPARGAGGRAGDLRAPAPGHDRSAPPVHIAAGQPAAVGPGRGDPVPVAVSLPATAAAGTALGPREPCAPAGIRR